MSEQVSAFATWKPEKGKLYITREPTIVTVLDKLPESWQIGAVDLPRIEVVTDATGMNHKVNRVGIVPSGFGFIFLGRKVKVSNRASFFQILAGESIYWAMFWEPGHYRQGFAEEAVNSKYTVTVMEALVALHHGVPATLQRVVTGVKFPVLPSELGKESRRR